jgi:DNA-directed RNA polymerase subunit RPC12/RpoP
MQRTAEHLPIVRCPGCEQPMEPRERTAIVSSERLVDVRYVCTTCGMETKRTMKEDS